MDGSQITSIIDNLKKFGVFKTDREICRAVRRSPLWLASIKRRDHRRTLTVSTLTVMRLESLLIRLRGKSNSAIEPQMIDTMLKQLSDLESTLQLLAR